MTNHKQGLGLVSVLLISATTSILVLFTYQLYQRNKLINMVNKRFEKLGLDWKFSFYGNLTIGLKTYKIDDYGNIIDCETELPADYSSFGKTASRAQNKISNNNIDVNDLNNFDKVISGDKLVLVDFYAVWCGPCKRMAPFIEQIKEERSEQVIVLSIDAEAHPKISGRYNLEGYPTLIFFKKGQVVASAIGYHDKNQILDLVNKFK